MRATDVTVNSMVSNGKVRIKIHQWVDGEQRFPSRAKASTKTITSGQSAVTPKSWTKIKCSL